MSDDLVPCSKVVLRFVLTVWCAVLFSFALALGIMGNHLALICFLPATIVCFLWNLFIFTMIRFFGREPSLSLRRLVDGLILIAMVALIIVFAIRNDGTGDMTLIIVTPLFASSVAVMTFVLILIGDGIAPAMFAAIRRLFGCGRAR